MSKAVIIGGGAAGMAAAIAAAGQGHEVHLYEKNEKLGKKVYITGKGRCNVTNACDVSEMMQNVVTNPRFLYSSFYGFTNQDMMNLLEQGGCPLKVERGGRVFPVSDKSSDVISALAGQMEDLGVKVYLHKEVKDLLGNNAQFLAWIQGQMIHLFLCFYHQCPLVSPAFDSLHLRMGLVADDDDPAALLILLHHDLMDLLYKRAGGIYQAKASLLYPIIHRLAHTVGTDNHRALFYCI